ncbi:IclR family acetate operon transcriptional repressor [Rhodococcus sp. 27YEA15]|uniref:IclR family transcriptional regulator n=1 Tax=Rhodococcus sp. 27YEA15 TaxID=3156259 RepID=UPI003C7B2F37
MSTPAVPKASGGVQSVERTFDLLEKIADAGGEMTLSELASQCDLPLPTIHRLLKTLIGIGYVRQLPNRRYGLGPRLIRLGEIANRQLGAVATPFLRELVQTLGETSNMAVLDSEMVVYLSQVPSPHSMRMFIEVGRRVRSHDTGVGKAILAQLGDAEVKSIVERAGMDTPTPTSHATLDSLLIDLAEIRARGYALDEQEQELGVRCVAMSVPGAPVPMAISVSGPISRVTDDFIARAVPELTAAAARISSALDNAVG